jgi:hypothetical protein
MKVKTDMKKILQLEIKLTGSCRGMTTTQVERTETKALYKRSDNYWECFHIKEVKEKVRKDGKWVETGDTIEKYPKDEDVGAWAWCDREKKIRERYEAM